MKTIGLIGGTSWKSTVIYYQLLNRQVNAALGGAHSAKCILYSVDFDQIEKNIAANRWDQIAATLGEAAKSLEAAGADFILICTNTLHKVLPMIKDQVSIPFLHIAGATADKIEEAGIKKIGLLGTKATMTQDFYKGILADRGLEVLTPTKEEDLDLINRVIFDELCHGVVKESSKREYQRIIGELAARGAEGIILGCTEIDLLIKQEDTELPIFDTTAIHAAVAVERALQD